MHGELRIWHWLAAIGIAVCAQVVVLAAVFSSEPAKDKPRQAGIVLQLTAMAAPGDSLENTGEPLAAVTVAKAPPRLPPKTARKSTRKSTRKPAPRDVARVAPKPTPKPKPAFKFEPKPSIAAVRMTRVPRSIEPTPEVATKTDTTNAVTATSTPGTVGARAATGPLAAAVPGAQSSQTKAAYEGKLLTWIAKHKRYPRLARRQGLEGVVEVTFQLDPKGRVQASSVSASSGYAILDQAVMQLLEQASPMPTPPDSFDAKALSFQVPVAFSLR